MSCDNVQQFPCKPVQDTPWLEFDFSDKLGTTDVLTGTPQVQITLLAGEDPDPAAVMVQGPILSGDKKMVQVQMGAGIVGNSYLWTVTATRQSTGLPVVAIGYITVT